MEVGKSMEHNGQALKRQPGRGDRCEATESRRAKQDLEWQQGSVGRLRFLWTGPDTHLQLLSCLPACTVPWLSPRLDSADPAPPPDPAGRPWGRGGARCSEIRLELVVQQLDPIIHTG